MHLPHRMLMRTPFWSSDRPSFTGTGLTRAFCSQWKFYMRVAFLCSIKILCSISVLFFRIQWSNASTNRLLYQVKNFYWGNFGIAIKMKFKRRHRRYTVELLIVTILSFTCALFYLRSYGNIVFTKLHSAIFSNESDIAISHSDHTNASTSRRNNTNKTKSVLKCIFLVYINC